MQQKITTFLDKDNTVGKLQYMYYDCIMIAPRFKKPEGESMNTRVYDVSFHHAVMAFSKQLYVVTVTRFKSVKYGWYNRAT